ncbi:BTB domain-containing protein, partial [Caerostris darwini]
KSSKKKWDKDVTLVVKDQSGSEEYGLKVQKKLLLESSAFFRDIPENEMKKHKKINMEGISSVALQKIVAFLQKGSARFSNHMEAIETLKATEKLKMEDLLNICINHLITTLEPGNVCEIYDAATTLCLSHLEYSCLMVIDKHAEEILGHRGFITLKKAKVLDIIKRCSLNIKSEVTVFRAVLSWGLNESLNRGLDPNNIDKFVPVVRHLLNHVRFWVMSEEERKDPEVSKYLRLLSSCELWKKDRSMSTTSQSSSGSYDLESQARHHVTSYNHNLNTFDSSQHTVKDGETFCLNLEILKGRIFLTSFKLAFGPFAKTKNTACLYVLLTATNLSTGEERSTRGLS